MTQYSDYFGPEGLLVRGTVLVVPGRGETRATYARFGRRLAADAYRVRVIDAPDLDTEDLPALAARITTAAEDTTAEDGVAGPLVLVGADSGAAAVAALLGQDSGTRPDAVILAGLPGRAPAVTATAGTWDEELDVRTSCPAHRGLLTQDTEVRRGSLDDAVPEAVLTAAYDSAASDSAAAVPVLLLVGDSDPLADHEALAHTAKSLGRARLSVVHGAHHDVLNDLQHRSVAAEVVTFLETLRNELRPLLTVRSSAW
ncbi:alpha/beta hydrolase [Streptomyces sp. N50]|uniref:alpha/beta hydrolase n=1 Tax=Streptomyces sp. N50 TaxID=3081765 RepID=UPI002961E98A|nr:alpha/beta fold hydrolase [Streptomyces sp. N50]WOX15203.1 alpha/beta hydrolase [Streptomyces sp. N50]